MKYTQTLIALLICAWLVSAVKVTIECRANDECSSKFEYFYGGDLSVCAETACTAGKYENNYVECQVN